MTPICLLLRRELFHRRSGIIVRLGLDVEPILVRQGRQPGGQSSNDRIAEPRAKVLWCSMESVKSVGTSAFREPERLSSVAGRKQIAGGQSARKEAAHHVIGAQMEHMFCRIS